MTKYFGPASAMRRELLATTMLATLALSKASMALAQTAAPNTGGGAIALPEVDVAGSQQGGGRFTGYSVPNAVSATKTDTPILQTPVAVQVVPRETMDDQQAISVQDAIASNVSSVALNPAGFSLNQSYTIRGFNTNFSTYQNGLLQPNLLFIDNANLQSIEVLKGPASMLYGRIEPGGLVDLVMKHPLETPYYSFQEQAGSFGLTRTTMDATGPLTADKALLYRINADFLHTNSFVDFVNAQNIFVAPSISYHPIEQFRLNIDAEYQHVINVDNQPNFPAVGRGPAPIPISRYLADPTVTVPNPDQYIRRYVDYNWTFDIANNWSVTNRFSYNSIRQLETNMFFACNTCLNTTTGVGTNSLIFGPANIRSIATNIEINGKFETGFLKHSLLIGTDYFNSNNEFNGFYNFAAQTINIYNQIYNGNGLAGQLSNKNGFAILGTQDWKGVYVQDMISALDDTVHLLIGGRYDWALAGSSVGFPTKNQLSNNALGNANQSLQQIADQAFSPRVGLNYQIVPWLAFYGSFSQSLGANNGLNRVTMQPLGAQKGLQWEGGAKAEFFDKRLSATVAFYDITKSNIATAIAGSPGLFDLLNAESKGVEIDVTGLVNDNWSLIANFSHDDARVTKGSPFNPKDPTDVVNEKPVVGNFLAAVPANMGNLWVKYDADGEFRGLSAAAGVSRIGAAEGDNANSFEIPAYTTLRGMLAYRFPWAGSHITAQVNVDNALDATYFYGGTRYVNRLSLTPGVPRTVLASLRLEF